MTPFETLLVGLAVLALLIVVFWPGWGIVSRWKNLRARTVRVQLEDALKHIYDCEYRGMKATLESIAGTLSISGDAAARLVSRLESLGLLKRQETGLGLTAEGRSYALRIIRVHRLWERYLADETTVRESEWHKRAEMQEHVMTPDEVNALDKRLGHPAFDPHGDPIPTSGGSIPSPQGVALTSLRNGESAGVVHIEDEPAAVYAQLVAAGLYPGMRVSMIEQTSERVLFEADGNEVVLAPVFAANVAVVPIPPEEQRPGPGRTLASLRPGERSVVAGISPACRGLQRRRLMDLGFVPGTVVEVQMRSAAGDPTAYGIRGATIALRREQAELVLVEEKGRDQT